MRTILDCFGLTINEAKSSLSPATRLEHLGLVVDFRKREFAVPPAKLCKLKSLAMELALHAASHRRYVPKRVLASFVGSAISLCPAVPAGRFHLLPLYDAINSVPGWKRTTVVRLSNGGYRQLKYFWTQLQLRDCAVPWEPATPDELLFTDSSDFGLGAHTIPL